VEDAIKKTKKDHLDESKRVEELNRELNERILEKHLNETEVLKTKGKDQMN